MEQISKPHIVSFLRMVDRHKWIRPRIRFASVRSKPELIADILRAFRVVLVGNLLRVEGRSAAYRGPRIEYDLKARQFLMDGSARDFPRESRTLPRFRVVRGPYHLDFLKFRLAPAARAQPAT